MRWLVSYIRSVFCKHDWEKMESHCSTKSDFIFERRKQGLRVSATCKKCGWHRSYWKF